MARGKFVSLEGIDGCGKSTVARLLLKGLTKDGVKAVLTAEPTGSWLGKAVRRGWAEHVDPLTEAFLFMADRVEHIKEISKWMAEGKLVVSDRYVDSTIAYQGAELEKRFRGKAPEAMQLLRKMHDSFLLLPDLTLYLRVTPETGMSRLSGRKGLTKFEKLAFLRKVARNYDLLAEREPRRIAVIDASRPLEKVAESALAAVRKLLK
jgi:dTMP kinase